MAVSSSQVTVGTTATLLADGSEHWSNNPLRVFVRNDDGSASMFLGGSGVTTSNGYEIEASTVLNDIPLAGDALYACVASGSAVAHVLKLNA